MVDLISSKGVYGSKPGLNLTSRLLRDMANISILTFMYFVLTLLGVDYLDFWYRRKTDDSMWRLPKRPLLQWLEDGIIVLQWLEGGIIVLQWLEDGIIVLQWLEDGIIELQWLGYGIIVLQWLEDGIIQIGVPNYNARSCTARGETWPYPYCCWALRLLVHGW